jgi:hypothetical protein
MPGGAEDVVAFGDVVGGLRLDVDAGDAGEEGCSFIERGGADVDGLIQQSGLRGGEGAEENAPSSAMVTGAPPSLAEPVFPEAVLPRPDPWKMLTSSCA